MPSRIDLRAELADIVDQLRVQGIPADLDREKVNTPGVFVTSNGVSIDGLDFYTVHALLYVMVPDRDVEPVLDDLSEVVNGVLVLWGNPDGDLTPATVQRQGGQVPALRIPVDFRCQFAPAPDPAP